MKELGSVILQAYISVFSDEKRATVTTAKTTSSSLLRQLKAAGITASEVGLNGRFHSQCHRNDLEPLIKFCDSQPALQFPDATEIVYPTRSNSGGDYIIHGKLHHVALQSLLVEQSDWYATFAEVQSSQLIDDHSLVVFFGSDRCVPPTLKRRLSPKLLHAAKLSGATPLLSTSVRGSKVHSQYARDLSDNAIAVVGMACKVPGANDIEGFWKILCDGRSQHVEVPGDRFDFVTAWRDVDSNKKWYGNFIEDPGAFDHKFFKKSPREMASTDPQQRLMLQTAYQAVEQSGYFQSTEQDKHIGCYIGAGCVDYEYNIACYPPNAFSATGNLKSFIAGKISHYFGWTGPALTIDTACSASAVAIHQACKAILSGECAAALAGGVNVMTSPYWFQNLAGASFLSPTGACKPFDAKADGYCRGDGIGVVFLKKMSTAITNGDHILGVIASTAVYQNQNCTSITVPNAESLSDLFHHVTSQAKLDPNQVSVIEAHGTGTPVGDPAEYESIRRVFGGPIRSDTLSLGSVKGLIGHTECASGILALIKTLLMIHGGAIPPQASFDTINPAIKASPSDNIEIRTTLRPWDVEFRAALINNYGASGSNASMIVTQAPNQSQDVMRETFYLPSDTIHPFWFCALDDQSLRAYAARFGQFLRSKFVSANNLSIANLAFNLSRQSNRSLSRALILRCSSREELIEKLKAFENGDQGISTVAPSTSRPVILCFGGQISKYVGLDRKVYNSVKVLRSYLDQCNSIYESTGLDDIYPEIFQRTPVEDPLKLQMMLFAMQYSCAKTWIDCGIQVAAVVGHSFGELTALCVSGTLSLRDAVKLVSGRAYLVRDSWGAEKGSMVAVEADLEDVERLIADSSNRYNEERATIACFNGPRSFTLAGTTKTIEALIEEAAENMIYSSMKLKKLNVTNAFHSTLVQPLVTELEQLGQGLTFEGPKIPLERATEFTQNLTSRFAAEHMRYPVYFNHAVQRLSKRYPSCIWLEAGSKSTITTMINRGLGSSSASYFQSINITSDNAMQNLTDATINLWKEGSNVLFWPYHSLQASEYAPLLLPPYQFEKSKHWLDLKKPPKENTHSEGQPQSPEDAPTRLYTFTGYQSSEKRSARFQINTTIQKFQDYISGHTIAQTAPLCPSTLQLDIVIEALMHIRPDFAAFNLQPQLQGLDNHAPMCIDASRLVWLDVETSDAEFHVWDWKIVSNAAYSSAATTLHVSGKVVFRSANDVQLQNDFARYERFVGHQRCLHLLGDTEAEHIIQGSNIYKTFADIVNYGSVYRGVQKIVGKDNESAGRIVKAYTAETWLDTPLSDSFCQVAGIYVNCMTDRSDQEIFISNRIEQWIRSPKLRVSDSRPEVWDVFACHHRHSDKEFGSDVFIFDSRNGALLEVILGINYQRVSKAALGKLLSRLTISVKDSEPASPSAVTKAISLPTPAKTVQAVKPSTPKDKKPSRPGISGSVRSLLANVSGLEPHEIKDDTGFAEIGIDSLMGMELAREIESVFKCPLDATQLADVTDFQSLIQCIQSALGPGNNDAIAKSEASVKCVENFESETENNSVEPDQDIIKTPMSSGSNDVEIEEQAGSASTVSHAPTPPELVQESPYMTGASRQINDVSWSRTGKGLSIRPEIVLEAFGQTKMCTDQFISEYKFGNYADYVLPKQTELCIAYIVQAFETLGCSIRTAKQGQSLERINYLPRHEKFVNVLYTMLEKEARLIDIDGLQITRTAISPPIKSVDTLLQDLIRNFPDHIDDHKLTHLTGSKLAECLNGESDGIQLIFGSTEGRDLVSSLYGKSPINMVWLKQMGDFIKRLISVLPMHEGPIKILEMGAGTGGTTAEMVPLLASLNVPVEYCFTDISPSMVAAARKRFREFSFLSFRVHDIEKPPAAELFHSQHVVIANNCVHATHSLTKSTKHIHSVLRQDGFLMMLEMTDTLYWVDMIFGLLEGWWLFDDGREHAVTHQSVWKKSMESVGYGHVDWTEGNRPEANLQRIIIALASGPRYNRLSKFPQPSQSLTTGSVDRQEAVDEYIRRYTQEFCVPVRSNRLKPMDPSTACVLLTGATGSLGSHLAAHFAALPNVENVICLNRHSSTDPALRQQQAIEARGIPLESKALSKLKAFGTDTAKRILGLPSSEYEYLIDNVTHIVHNAWPMSIKRPLKAFEQQFQAMRNLIDLASEISCRRLEGSKIGFQFISSIATVGYHPLRSGQVSVPEERMTVESALPSGYSDAKLVCERILDETLYTQPHRFRPAAVRIGQIAGSKFSGYWNPMEHLSFLIKSSQTLKALPDLKGVRLSSFPYSAKNRSIPF